MILRFSGLPRACVIVAHQLERGVVGLGAGVDEQRLGHRHRRHRQQALGELDRRPVRLAAEQVVGRQARELLLRRLHQPRLAEAERGAPQAGHALEVAAALGRRSRRRPRRARSPAGPASACSARLVNGWTTVWRSRPASEFEAIHGAAPAACGDRTPRGGTAPGIATPDSGPWLKQVLTPRRLRRPFAAAAPGPARSGRPRPRACRCASARCAGSAARRRTCGAARG